MKRFFLFALFLGISCSFLPAQDKFEPPPSKPLTPAEEQKTFRLDKGFTITLAAGEPDVVDPVALAFDEQGRLFIAEMHGYPNGGVGVGDISSGKIKMLQDKDGDGLYETVTLFADGLRLPTAVMPCGGGLLVANAPDLIFLKDTDGDGKADQRRVLYTGFDLGNIQQLVNSLQWGMDNWVHANCGGKGGIITCPEKKDFPPLTLRGRGIRFHPDIPGSLEPTSGGGQFGLAPDAFGFWFTSTNSQVLRHIVLPDHYLMRNPHLIVPATTVDIHQEGTAPKINRISPFEAWRVERTRRRKDGADFKRFPTTELIPGGFITSACSPVIYLGGAFPEGYEGNAFVCDPANNLLHRMILEPKGPATFSAKRASPENEFLASTDNWFRPVNMTIGPDGALYVADFYREVIETPLSLPEDMKKVLTLKSQARGRIWRIAASGDRKTSDDTLPGKASPDQWVGLLASPNVWQRYTAQRLLIERGATAQKKAVQELLRKTPSPTGKVHALWTLQGLGCLDEADLLFVFRDESPDVRVHGARLAEPRLDKSETLREGVISLLKEATPRLRFQIALSLGACKDKRATQALGILARKEGADSWMQTAILTSVVGRAGDLVTALAPAPKEKDLSPLLPRLAQMIAASGNEDELVRLLGALDPGPKGTLAPWHFAVLDGLIQGWQARGIPPESILARSRPELRAALKPLAAVLAAATEMAANAKVSPEERTRAIRLLSMQPLQEIKAALLPLLAPTEPLPVQLAVVQTLAQYNDPLVGPLLLQGWPSYSPTVRREVVEVLLARPQRVAALLDGIEAKKVQPNLFEPSRLDQLRKHPDAELRKRAVKLLAAHVLPERAKVLKEFEAALDLKGEVRKGRAVFRKNCIACHKLENVGQEVGADLRPILSGKTPERLLVDILDPSREVDPRYLHYMVETKSGLVLTGILAAESAAGITLRRAEKLETTLLRSDIETILTSAQSFMPEGLERQISREEMADLIAYLLEMGRKK